MTKMMDKLRCNPLYCLAVFFTINAFLFGWIKSDISEIRRELKEYNQAIMARSRDFGFRGPTTQKLALKTP